MGTMTEIAATALVASSSSERKEMEELLRAMGFLPIHVESLDQAGGLRYPVALCLVDLRQNGEAMKIARAVRAQHPQAIVIGVADPARPTAAADAIRAGVFDVLPRP